MYGERLKKLRKSRGLGVEQVSQALNIPMTTISGYENEHRKPNLYTLSQFADYYNVTTDYLIGRIDIPSPYSDIAKSHELNDYRLYEAQGIQIVARISKNVTPLLFQQLQKVARTTDQLLSKGEDL